MNEEMRKEFEVWILSSDYNNSVNPSIISKNKDGSYESETAQAWWCAWKASREAMKPIKLPDATFETPSGDGAFREDAVIEAIQQAGYEVAE